MNARILTSWPRRPAGYLAVSATAVGLAVLAARLFAHLYGLGTVAASVLAVLQNAPLLLSLDFPLSAWCLMMGADLVAAPFLLHAPGLAGNSWPWPTTVLVGQLLALTAVAARPQRISILAMVWATPAVAGYALAHASAPNSDGSDTLLAVGGAVILIGGQTVHERAETRRRLAAQQLANQAERARLTLLEERTRIARELHDVVAHHMSVIAVQADTAAYRIEALPGVAVDEFTSLAGTARSALTEMRRLLGVLRDERDERDGARQLAPQPGLDRLSELVDGAAKAGIRTELVLGERVLARVGAHPGVQLAAYRLVQERLANVVRHAPGAETRVALTVDDDGLLRVLVVNQAPPDPRAAPLEAGEAGHGLIGMRERMLLVGGTLAADRLPGGGFRVDARIPLPSDGGAAS